MEEEYLEEKVFLLSSAFKGGVAVSKKELFKSSRVEGVRGLATSNKVVDAERPNLFAFSLSKAFFFFCQ